MKIIMLGFDNTGKTTTAKRLEKDLKALYPSHSVEGINSIGKSSLEQQEIWMRNSIENDHHIFIHIHDRFPLFEEMVYGEVLRDGSNFDFKDDDLGLYHIKPLLIYNRPPDEVIFNFGERDQMEGVIEWRNSLLERYDGVAKLASENFGNFYRYDYTESESAYNKLLGICIRYIERQVIASEVSNKWY